MKTSTTKNCKATELANVACESCLAVAPLTQLDKSQLWNSCHLEFVSVCASDFYYSIAINERDQKTKNKTKNGM